MLSMHSFGQMTGATSTHLARAQQDSMKVLRRSEFWLQDADGAALIEGDLKEAWRHLANYRVHSMKGRDVKRSLIQALIIAVAYTPITELTEHVRFLSERENRVLFAETMYEAYILSEVLGDQDSEERLISKGYLEKDKLNLGVLKSAGKLFIEKVSALTQASGAAKLVDEQVIKEMKDVIESSVALANDNYRALIEASA